MRFLSCQDAIRIVFLHIRVGACIRYNMIRAAWLFVGAVVGAGFATGQEVLVFFGGQSIHVCWIAGCIAGGMCTLFLLLGRARERIAIPCLVDTGVEIVLWLGACATFVCMVSAAEGVFLDAIGIRGIGLWTGMVFALWSVFPGKWADVANSVTVPVLCLLTIVVAVGSPLPVQGRIDGISAFQYCAMNILLGGYVVSDAGRSLTVRQCVGAGVCTAVAMSILLICVYATASQYPHAAMPVLAFATSHGKKAVCAVVIYLAVCTTMAGSGSMIATRVKSTRVGQIGAVLLLSALAMTGSASDFAQFVRTWYPRMGYLGIGYVAYALLVCLVAAVSDRKVHAARHAFLQ